MTPEITFELLPSTDPAYDVLGSDECFSICVDGRPRGIVYMSEDRYTADDTLGHAYIDWIEFVYAYRGTGLLRPVMNALYEKYGELTFEATKAAWISWYCLGCESLGIDSIIGLEKFRYTPECKHRTLERERER